jgi:hypothetical protein
VSALLRSFLLGRTSGQAVVEERRQTLDLLAEHGRLAAGLALSRGASVARREFEAMRSWLYAGGMHCVRLTGGRSIERRR